MLTSITGKRPPAALSDERDTKAPRTTEGTAVAARRAISPAPRPPTAFEAGVAQHLTTLHEHITAVIQDEGLSDDAKLEALQKALWFTNKNYDHLSRLGSGRFHIPLSFNFSGFNFSTYDHPEALSAVLDGLRPLQDHVVQLKMGENLYSCSIFTSLAAALPNLRILSLAEGSIGSDEAAGTEEEEDYVRSLTLDLAGATFPNLVSLYITGNNFSDEEVHVLAQAIIARRTFPVLTCLVAEREVLELVQAELGAVGIRTGLVQHGTDNALRIAIPALAGAVRA